MLIVVCCSNMFHNMIFIYFHASESAKVFADRDIAIGEQITINYAAKMQPTEACWSSTVERGMIVLFCLCLSLVHDDNDT